MAISTQIQNLNLIPGKSAPVVVHLSQGNVGNTVQFYLYDGDNPYYPTNVSIAVHGVRADGSVFGPYNVSTTSSSNLVSFNIVTAMTSVNGAAIGELVLTDSNQNQIGSANFGMLVEAAPYSSSVTYEDDLSIYRRILAYVQSIHAELRNDINTEQVTRAAADNNLQTQINQIIAPSGEAPSAAEVQNARIGVDGTVYDTLGSAIRGQITDLKSDIEKESSDIGVVFVLGTNILNPAEIEPGRITALDSNVSHSGTYDTDYRTTGFMPVTAGKKYGFHIQSGTAIGGMAVSNIWAYGADKSGLEYLGSIAYNSDGLSYVTAPAGAAYLRASYSTYDYGTIMVSEVTGTTKPSEIVAYNAHYELHGYADEEEFDEFSEKIDSIIDDAFSPVYSAMTGTTTARKFIESNGTIADIASDNYSILSVGVTPGETYKITAQAYNGKYYFGFYDSNNAFISGTKATGSGTTTITDNLAMAPENAATLVACSALPTFLAIIEVKTGYKSKSEAKWESKKWVCVGDSLTEINVATTKHYYDYVVDASGINVHNMGVGGTGYVRGYDSSKAFYQRISSVPTDADVVTIFGSGNDCNIEAMSKFDNMTWAQALGTYTDATTDTICGCVNATLDAYFAVMVTAPIGIIAPTPWKSYPTTKLTNNRFEDYTNALKQIAAYRGVPFLDLYHYSNLRPENEDNCNACFYNGASLDGNGDGVHPNELGHKIIAPKIYEFVKTMLLDWKDTLNQ